MSTDASAQAAPAAATAAAGSTPAAARVRHEWYQNDQFVIVSVFIKGAKKEDVAVDFHEKEVSVAVKFPNTSSEYSLELDLAHEIVPGSSKFVVMSTKVEISLAKKDAGLKWGVLEGHDPTVVYQSVNVVTAPPPSYPSSSKHKVDWSSLEKDISKEEKEEKPEGEAALNQLFQTIYANASEETRRAMNKSYLESGGTCLSTNWEEVGKSKVEVKPPDGMEVRKYEL